MAKKSSWVEIVLKTGGVVAFALILGALKQTSVPSGQQPVAALSQQQNTGQQANIGSTQPNNQNGYYEYSFPNSSQNQPVFQSPRQSRSSAS